jgi:hypothetical protein
MALESLLEFIPSDSMPLLHDLTLRLHLAIVRL